MKKAQKGSIHGAGTTRRNTCHSRNITMIAPAGGITRRVLSRGASWCTPWNMNTRYLPMRPVAG